MQCRTEADAIRPHPGTDDSKEAAPVLNISSKTLLYKTRQCGIEGPGRQSSRFVNSA